MNNEDFKSLKRVLRRRLRQNRPSPETCRKQDGQISARLNELFQNWPKFAGIEASAIPEHFTIGGYAPLPGEVHWHEGLAKKYSGRVCFPALRRGEMKFCRCRLQDLIKTREFGACLPTPPANAPETRPEVVLVPGLAFTRTGKRLGRGKGFYDRYLADYPGIKIGLAFPEQLLEDIPTEAHDVPMDLVVCADGVFDLRI